MEAFGYRHQSIAYNIRRFIRLVSDRHMSLTEKQLIEKLNVASLYYEKKLLKYLEPLQKNINDRRVRNKVQNVVSKMVSNQTTRLWTISTDKREFERMRNLFNGELKSVLDDEKISTALREEMALELGNSEIVYAMHDPCDIRNVKYPFS